MTGLHLVLAIEVTNSEIYIFSSGNFLSRSGVIAIGLSVLILWGSTNIIIEKSSRFFKYLEKEVCYFFPLDGPWFGFFWFERLFESALYAGLFGFFVFDLLDIFPPFNRENNQCTNFSQDIFSDTHNLCVLKSLISFFIFHLRSKYNDRWKFV